MRIKSGPSKEQLLHSLTNHRAKESEIFFITTDNIRLDGYIQSLGYLSEDDKNFSFSLCADNILLKGYYNVSTHRGTLKIKPVDLVHFLLKN